MVRGLVGSQSRFGRGGEEINSYPLSGIEPPIIEPVAQRYATELFRLLYSPSHSFLFTSVFALNISGILKVILYTFSLYISNAWLRTAATAQSVQATGWTIRVLGFDSRQGLGIFLFTTASRTALGPTQPPIQWVQRALSLAVKRPGREADHSPPCSAEVKEWVELYLHLQYAFVGLRPVRKKHRDNFMFTLPIHLTLG
jgi:hypothetical protein